MLTQPLPMSSPRPRSVLGTERSLRTDAFFLFQLICSFYGLNDIDLYVGGLVEKPLIGALVGPTFACIIGDQLKRTRDGDRFYYENPGIFSSAQLAELKKTSLARLFCDNGDHISKVPFNALLRPAAIATVPCAGLAQLDLRKWSRDQISNKNNIFYYLTNFR
ncbi:hypothetical protein niasHT_018594 [Heterodera trifolii]|uniref:Peroxidase n=1 Tax=Heterodera trifolii TaxID=157864 RepID=A0ABD2LBG7_9BILA